MNRVSTFLFAGAAQCASIRNLPEKTPRTAGGTEAAFTRESLERPASDCNSVQKMAAESRKFRRRARKKHRALAALQLVKKGLNKPENGMQAPRRVPPSPVFDSANRIFRCKKSFRRTRTRRQVRLEAREENSGSLELSKVFRQSAGRLLTNTIRLKNVSVQCECAAQSPFAQDASGKAPGFDKAGLKETDETIEKTLRRACGRGRFCMKCMNASCFAAKILCNQRLENWGARRAAFRPYFLRSFIRGSRVRKPAFLMAGFRSTSALTRARAMP